MGKVHNTVWEMHKDFVCNGVRFQYYEEGILDTTFTTSPLSHCGVAIYSSCSSPRSLLSEGTRRTASNCRVMPEMYTSCAQPPCG